MLENGKATFLSGEALLANRRVKVKSGTTTDPVQVEYADAGEQAIGETEYGVADATLVEVRLVTAPGTHLCAAHDTFARGAVLYGEHDGLVSDASSGSAVGVALTAATGANDIVEWLPFSVLSTTAATVSVADSGSFTATATVEAALAEIYQHLMSVQKSVPISLGSITREDGTALTTQATTVTGNGRTTEAIPIERVREVLKKYGMIGG